MRPAFWSPGTLDISDALIFYGARGTPPVLLLQVIASGLLGRSALQLGLRGALLGLAIHYFITCAWATLPHTREVGHPAFTVSVLCNAVGALIFFMGLPIAILSRRMLAAD